MTRRTRRWSFAALIALVALLVTQPGSRSHVRAASLLLRFSSPEAERATWVAKVGSHDVDVAMLLLDTPAGKTRARLYMPHDVVDAPGLVVVHGVHRLGVEEPRLERFARSVASAGVVVMTPEIVELTDYRIDARSIATIGAAAKDLSGRLHRENVGVMGLSFAGGLSLLAAADETWAPHIAFVVAVGAHDDLARVGTFFATNTIEDADGNVLPMKAHDYGILVLVYGHTGDFFAGDDVAPAHDALRALLWGETDRAKALAAKIPSDAGRAKMQLLLEQKDDAIARELTSVLARPENVAAMRAVSPHGRLASLHVPVYLLHGAGDNVIPPTETNWLARSVPAPWMRIALVSPAVQHVELHGEPTAMERWALVHFMASVLDESDREAMLRADAAGP